MIIVKIKGGLGNQLFQYATARNISISKQVPIKVDTSFFRNEKYKGIFHLTYYNTIIEEATTQEIDILTAQPSASIYARICRKYHLPGRYYKKTHLIENNIGPFDGRIINCDGNAYIEGWYQNEKYFKGIRDILLEEFNLKNNIIPKTQELQEEISNCESVSIHFRRGDYLTNKFFGEVSLDYYSRAVNYIMEKAEHPIYYIFSDDIDWVKNNLRIDGKVHYLTSSKASDYHTENDFEDLILMKKCKHNIIANSSFSWWAAWLNTNPFKIVIAPKKWYNDPNAQKYYEKGRLRISNWIYL
jgi:hypothetical protein